MTRNRREFLRTGIGALALGGATDASEPESVEIATDQIRLGLILAKDKAVRIGEFRNAATRFNWATTQAPAGPVFSCAAFDEPSYVAASWTVDHHEGISIEYRLQSLIQARQHYRIADGLPLLQCAGDFLNISSNRVEGVTEFGLTIPLRPDLGPLQVHCASRDAYAIQRIPFQQKLELCGGRWNSPEYAALLVLEAMEARELLVIGVEQERGWRFRVNQREGVIWLQMEVMDLLHTIERGKSIALPGMFFGVVHGDADDAFRLGQQYLQKDITPKALRHWPWVVYDIWGTEADGVEQGILDEIEPAAELGVELLYIDAAWYQGSSKKGDGDWGCGLGRYKEDREKFPHGLAHVARKVHDSGMAFGLWIGPNIVDSRLVPGEIPHLWIAQKDGEDRVLKISTWESPCLQVCLGCPEYVDHLKQDLSRIVTEFRLDWLKWDNSGIPGSPGVCNRSDHGHQGGDGSYAALLGEYDVFSYLHRKFPELVLEQCGYGSRLDLGLAGSIRANWLSDASFPSLHVRQNALVASYIYPSSYNGAWIVRDKEIEETKDPAILETIYRSRMMGLFGFGTLNGMLRERISLFPTEALEAARRTVPFYKRYRHLLRANAYHLFPPGGSPEGWQAVQFTSEDGKEAVILSFRSGSKQPMMRLSVKGLQRNLEYKITSANGAAFPAKAGSQILRDGLVVTLEQPEMSEVILLQSQQGAL